MCRRNVSSRAPARIDIGSCSRRLASEEVVVVLEEPRAARELERPGAQRLAVTDFGFDGPAVRAYVDRGRLESYCPVGATTVRLAPIAGRSGSTRRTACRSSAGAAEQVDCEAQRASPMSDRVTACRCASETLALERRPTTYGRPPPMLAARPNIANVRR